MSLSEFQRAMTNLIRLPEQNRGGQSDSFVSQYELGADEQAALKALAQDPRLSKYGRDMRDVRYRRFRNALPPGFKAQVTEGVFRKLFYELFDEKSPRISYESLVTGFLRFILTNDQAKQALRFEDSPHLQDLIQYELNQLLFRYRQIKALPPSNRGTSLIHTGFSVLSLSYDIPAYIKSLRGDRNALSSQGSDNPSTPALRRAHFLMLVSPELTEGYRVFEIDEKALEFLKQELHGQSGLTPLPSGYGELVRLGLCRSRTEHNGEKEQ